MPEGLIAVPIVAIVMGVFAVVIALGLNYRKRKEIFTLYHSERMLALEKGVPLPPLPALFIRGPSAVKRRQTFG